jgi:hypothetical protein
MSQKEEVSAKEFRGRFDPVLHQKIKSAAKDSFRSMTAEIVYRLAKSFEAESARAAHLKNQTRAGAGLGN